MSAETRWSDSETTPNDSADVGDRPEAPSSIPKYIREGLQKQSAEDLRTIAGYATKLANYREEQKQRELEEEADRGVDETPEKWDDGDWQEELEKAREKADLPETKGSLTEKTIDGRDYYYLQWREGSKIKSQYVAPVTPADSD